MCVFWGGGERSSWRPIPTSGCFIALIALISAAWRPAGRDGAASRRAVAVALRAVLGCLCSVLRQVKGGTARHHNCRVTQWASITLYRIGGSIWGSTPLER